MEKSLNFFHTARIRWQLRQPMAARQLYWAGVHLLDAEVDALALAGVQSQMCRLGVHRREAIH